MPSSLWQRLVGHGSATPGRAWAQRALFAAVVLGVAGYLLRDVLFGVPVETVAIVRGDIAQSVVASGRVMSPQRVSIGAPFTEWVASIPVAEGQAVKQGDPLLVLVDRDERAAVAQARAAVAQAEAKLRQLRDASLPAAEQALVQARANALLARQQYERAQNLKEKGFVSQSGLDDARRNVDVAESQLKAADVQFRSDSAGGSNVQMAQADLAQAQSALGVAQARLDQSVVRAPVDGILIGRKVEPGDVVQPGKELMVLAPSGETQIVVQIDEKNLAQLKIGQKALASADAYPGQRFGAELFYINPGVDALRGAVEVKLRVPNPPPYLRQDMTVSVDIETGRHNATLSLPATAVYDAAGAQPWVLVVDGQRAARRPVKVGLRGEGRVEILEGLDPADRVLAATVAPIAPGQRVRVATARESGTP